MAMEGSNSGVTVVGSDAPSDYHVAARTTENPTTQTVTSQVVVVSPTPATAVSAGAGLTALSVKKKRGRPRKYAPDGSVNVLSPKPISSSAPSPVIDFSSSEKRGKIRPVGLVSKIHQQPKVDLETPGEWVSCSVGANFTPHIITVNTGEDVTMKVISFSQQGPRAICILSANGVISSVTLRQPDSSGGTLTYEGRFEILSLTGSFMPSETGGMRNRSGGMSVSLASPDGRVVGGGVAGLLVAASPVQMVGEVEKMVTVGLVWGATNALMRKGAIKWDESIKSLPKPNTPQHKIMTTLKNWFKLVLIWQYSLPFVLNLSASATFFAILSDMPISLAVPVTNATTFAATAVFGLILGEEILVGRALFGTFLVVLGVYICIM